MNESHWTSRDQVVRSSSKGNYKASRGADSKLRLQSRNFNNNGQASGSSFLPPTQNNRSVLLSPNRDSGMA